MDKKNTSSGEFSQDDIVKKQAKAKKLSDALRQNLHRRKISQREKQENIKSEKENLT